MGQTFSYLKKNFFLPIVAMLVPAALACFLSTPYWEVSFVAAFDYQPYVSAARTFRILFGDSWQYLWPVILIAVAQVFGAAYIMSSMDRHFRSGKLSFANPWRMINNSIFPIAIGVIVMSVFSIVWRLLLFGLVMLVQVSTQAMGLHAGAALAAISVIAVGLFLIHIVIIAPMLFWAPIMFIYGYRFRDAAAASFKLISGKKIFRALILPMLPCAGIQLLVGFLGVHIAIAIAVNFVAFLFTNVYTTVFTMIAFYDVSGLERRDIKHYQTVPLPPPVKKTEPQSKDKDKDKDKDKPKPSASGDSSSAQRPNAAKPKKQSKKQPPDKKNVKQTKPSENKKSAKKSSDKSKARGGATNKEKPNGVKTIKPTESEEGDNGV